MILFCFLCVFCVNKPTFTTDSHAQGNVSAWGIWLMRCTEVRKSWAEEDERSREFVGWNEAKTRVKVDLREILTQAERYFNPPA